MIRAIHGYPITIPISLRERGNLVNALMHDKRIDAKIVVDQLFVFMVNRNDFAVHAMVVPFVHMVGKRLGVKVCNHILYIYVFVHM